MRFVTPATVLLFCLVISGCAEADSIESEASPNTEQEPIAEATQTPTINVVLTEYAFEIAQDSFEVGVPYTFSLTNEGLVAHEWAVVPRGDQDENAMLIEVEDDELPAGGSYEVEFTFEEAGEFDFVCFMTDPVSHDASGMRVPITVVAIAE